MPKNEKKVKVIIPKSGKCSWGKCIFCGYGKEEYPVNVQVLKAWLDKQLLDFHGDTLVVYCSGSFLDDAQFPKEFRKYLVKKCKEKGIKHLQIESRPEFITDEKLEEFKGLDLTVAIGLEVADNEALKRIAKGMTVEDFIEAANKVHKHGFKVKAYVLVNLPVPKARELFNKTMEFARNHADKIVVMNLLPHGRTPLLDMWARGDWKPLSRKEFEEWIKPFKDWENVEFEFETFKFVPNIPPERRVFLKGVGTEFIDHPWYNIWQDWFSRIYEPPKGKDIALFVPCSYTKPYSRSRTHRLIDKAIKASGKANRVHKLVISSPGIIPFEFNDYYPFNAYDWDERLETPEIMKVYVEINRERIRNYLKNHRNKYKHFLAYFRLEAESLEALKLACDDLGIELKLAYNPETYKKLVKSGEKKPLFRKELLDQLTETLKTLD